MKPICLTIAGADPSSGAGIQADIRTFDRLGVYPFSVITALTYQTINFYNGFTSLSNYLNHQLKVLFDNYPIKIIKIGMIPDEKALEIIRRYIIEYDLKAVLDPVTSSSAGGRLSSEGLELQIERELFPITTVLTPNFDEALYYSKKDNETLNSIEEAEIIGLQLLEKLQPSKRVEKAVVIKSVSINKSKEIFDHATLQKESEKFHAIFKKKKINLLTNVHGTGCVFSSAIAAFLAKGYDIESAIRDAETFFDERFQKLLEFPKEGISLDLGYSSEQVDVINQIKEIYTFISEDRKFSDLIPEVRMNISGAIPSAQSKEEIAGIEGRVSIVKGFPKAAGEIKFGVSDHTARLILTAKEFDSSINFAMNLKFDLEWIKKLTDNGELLLQEIKREEQPKSVSEKEYSTMQWFIKESIDKLGSIPDIIWDKGAIGKEPMMRLFSKNSKEMIKKLAIIKKVLFAL